MITNISEKKDTICFRVNYVQENKVGFEDLPYKIFFHNKRWIFFYRTGLSSKSKKPIIDFLNQHSLYDEKIRLWPLFSQKYGYFKVYKNSKNKEYEFRFIDPNELDSKQGLDF